MISDRALADRQVNDSELKSVPKEMRIPVDTDYSRHKFKQVPGMTTFLTRQYKAMLKREEEKLAAENLGKLKE